jgi:hypothetical protein
MGDFPALAIIGESHSGRALLHPPFPRAALDRMCYRWPYGNEKQLEQMTTVYTTVVSP